MKPSITMQLSVYSLMFNFKLSNLVMQDYIICHNHSKLVTEIICCQQHTRLYDTEESKYVLLNNTDYKLPNKKEFTDHTLVPQNFYPRMVFVTLSYIFDTAVMWGCMSTQWNMMHVYGYDM